MAVNSPDLNSPLTPCKISFSTENQGKLDKYLWNLFYTKTVTKYMRSNYAQKIVTCNCVNVGWKHKRIIQFELSIFFVNKMRISQKNCVNGNLNVTEIDQKWKILEDFECLWS